METLTQARLRDLLIYDHETGIFTWRVDRIRVRAGEKAGKLSKDGYVVIGVDGRYYLAHRLAFLYVEGEFPDIYVDHINLVRSDNRWVNLRIATNSQNQMNHPKKANNTSGFKGVSWHKGEKRWRADIRFDGKKKFLGFFDTPELGHQAYSVAANENHREFARVS